MVVEQSDADICTCWPRLRGSVAAGASVSAKCPNDGRKSCWPALCCSLGSQFGAYTFSNNKNARCVNFSRVFPAHRRQTMYQGVLRDDERRRVKMRQREEDLRVSQEKRALYESVQQVEKPN